MPLLNRVSALREKLERQDGQTIIEYAFVAGGVSVVLLTAFVAIGILDDFPALLTTSSPTDCRLPGGLFTGLNER